MKKIKGIKKFGAVAAAVCATAGIVGGMSVPTLADPTGASGSVTGTDNLQPADPITNTGGFYKYLLMPESANTPAATMSFAIAPGTAVEATAGNPGTPQILAGVGTPSVYDATFTDGQATSTDETTVITAALLNGRKYAKSEVKVDFSNVTFVNPGIYRYEITETDVDSLADISIDTNTYYLDVYVQNDSSATGGGLKIDGYVFHSTDDLKQTPGGRYMDGNEIDSQTMYRYTDGADYDETFLDRDEAVAAAIAHGGTADDVEEVEADKKKDGLLNTMETKDLTVKKTISGNMADVNEEFGFSVVLDDDGDANTTGVVNTYYWQVYDASTQDQTTGEDVAVDGKNGTLTGGGDGTITVALKGDEYIKVTGLPAKATYSITETKDPDYVLTAITGAAQSDTTAGTASGAMDANKNVVYNNAKDVTTPTGIVTQYLPFFIMAGAGVGVAVFFAVRKKRSEAED